MPSKFGGIPVDAGQARSKFGGLPVDPNSPDYPGDTSRLGPVTLTQEQSDALDADATRRGRKLVQDSIDYRANLPTTGMSSLSRAGAGVGRWLSETGRGANQLNALSMTTQSDLAARGLDAIGLNGAGDFVREHVTNPSLRRYGRTVRAEQDARELDAPLMHTVGGNVGYMGATIGSLLLPGAMSKGIVPALEATTAAPAMRAAAPVVADVGRVMLPTSASGAAAQGAVIGAMRPVVDESERASNTVLGAGAGAAGVLVPKGIMATLRGGRAAVEPLTQAGQERIVARTLQRSAVDGNRLGRAAPSAIPNVRRTLAEETQDAGIANLQRQFPVQLADQAVANNQARTAAIRSTFGGADNASEAALRDQAGQQATRAARGLRNARPPSMDQVRTAIDSMSNNRTFRPEVKKTLDYVKSLAQQAPRNAEEAWQLRQTIGDLMDGKVGGDLASSKLARRELTTIRYLLDREMSAVYPEWGKFLRGYKATSRTADQVAVGRELLDPTSQMVDDVGNRTLTPAHLARVSNDPDALVRSATGFRRASADRTLTPEQRSLIGALGDDASRMNTATTAGRMVGSNTAQNMATQNILSQLGGRNGLTRTIAATQPAQRVMGLAEKTYGLLGVPERLHSVMAEALSNPESARRMITRLPAGDRSLIEDALVRAGHGSSLGLLPAYRTAMSPAGE